MSASFPEAVRALREERRRVFARPRRSPLGFGGAVRALREERRRVFARPRRTPLGFGGAVRALREERRRRWRSVRERLIAPLIERIERFLSDVAAASRREWEEEIHHFPRYALNPATSRADFRGEMLALRDDVRRVEDWADRRSGAGTPVKADGL
jgi:hypothetical protein